jgi:hypothetical protein
MEPRMDAITLAVGDLERAREFHRALGRESSGVVGVEFSRDATNRKLGKCVPRRSGSAHSR